MKRHFFITLFTFFSLFSVFAETYGQVENRFTLWYKPSVWEKLDEKVSAYIDDFNNDRTHDNAKILWVWASARYAYWQTVRRTAEALYEGLGDMGRWNYDKVFETAGDVEELCDEELWNLGEYFSENYPEWDFHAEITLGGSYYGDSFRIAKRP